MSLNKNLFSQLVALVVQRTRDKMESDEAALFTLTFLLKEAREYRGFFMNKTSEYPLQKWICAACVLRLWCSECCTCASCTYVQNMCKLLPYLIYAQHVCHLCTRHALLAHMHATGMLHKCLLHVCILLQYCVHAACTHASY